MASEAKQSPDTGLKSDALLLRQLAEANFPFINSRFNDLTPESGTRIYSGGKESVGVVR